jgi:hypothetical protein
VHGFAGDSHGLGASGRGIASVAASSLNGSTKAQK